MQTDDNNRETRMNQKKKNMQTDDNTMVMRTDLCGEVVKEDIVHSTACPGHSVFCFVQFEVTKTTKTTWLPQWGSC